MQSSAETQIRSLLDEINAAWVKGPIESLNRLLHPEMVIVDPDIKLLAGGRDKCVQSYRDFLDQAVVHDFNESDHAVAVFGPAAVAGYRFEISYEMKGETLHEAGRDLFVFVLEDGEWRAVWRAELP